MELTCKECKYYLPVDVFRGICKRTKERILPEDPVCDRVEQLPMCRFCQHFSSVTEHLGNCRGSTLAYPGMSAVNCEEFTWIQQN